MNNFKSVRFKRVDLMTDFKAWTKMCAEFNTEIWPLYEATDRPETGLYMTKRSYWQHNTKFYYSPVYTVWIGDSRECVTENMNEAMAFWKHRAKEENIEFNDKFA